MKKIILFLVVIIVAVQFIPGPPKNEGIAQNLNDIQHAVSMDSAISNILKRSCFDCHSNHTNYPWYSGAQPLAMWIGRHIEEGKDELNFSAFGSYSSKKQYHKLEEIAEQIGEDEMPLASYKIIHRSAGLSNKEKQLVIRWAQEAMQKIRKVESTVELPENETHL
jgi:hypothetical protein